MKVKIKKRLEKPGVWKNPDMPPTIHFSESLPFVENSRATLIHRVQSISQHKLPHWKSHLAIHMWCGQVQAGRDKFTFHDDPPKDKLLCQRCEDMALLFGEKPADELVGRHVHKGKVKAVRTCCKK